MLKSPKITALVLMILALSLSVSAVQDMDIDLYISKNDVVSEDITLTLISDSTYEIVEFVTVFRPLSIIYDGEYSIKRDGGNYVIEFEKDITIGTNEVSFSILYDDLIDKSFNERVFRTSFYPKNVSSLDISLTLPTHFVLSEKSPSSTPRPDSISSDGQRITLSWKFDNPESADISVFYTGQRNSTLLIIVFLISIVLISLVLFFYSKKRLKKHIGDMLSDQELKVITELEKGVVKQKEIGANLNFSKSKLSKIVGRLEEKNLVEKKPHFKTNVLRLLK